MSGSEQWGSAPKRVVSNRLVDGYILKGETPVVICRRHWAKIAEPIGTAAITLVLMLAVTLSSSSSLSTGVAILWLLCVAVAGRAIWQWLEWRNDWFVATDKRLLLIYGLIFHKIAMMPLNKVTDMSFSLSPLGRILGYGEFLMESAGQDQAMRKIDWVASPHRTYLRICAILFDAPDDDSVSGSEKHAAHIPGIVDHGQVPAAPHPEHRDAGATMITDLRRGTPGVPPPAKPRWVPPPAIAPDGTPPAPERRRPWTSITEYFSTSSHVTGPPTDPDVTGWDVSDEDRGQFVSLDNDSQDDDDGHHRAEPDANA